MENKVEQGNEEVKEKLADIVDPTQAVKSIEDATSQQTSKDSEKAQGQETNIEVWPENIE